MATVERKVVEIETFILELTPVEADVLKTLVGYVQGWHHPRNVTSGIYCALDEAGVVSTYKLKNNVEFVEKV